MIEDVRFAARLLRRSPVFTTAAVLTLALGIAVNTAVFSVVNAVLLRPLPVRDGSALVVLATVRAGTASLRPVSYADLQDYRSGSQPVFEDIAGYSAGFAGFAANDRSPERVLVTSVTGNYFSLLDIRPERGRFIAGDEGGPGRVDAVAVVGYRTWQRRLGGDPAIVGTSVRLNGRPVTIIGVAPREFHGTFAFSESEFYLPLNWTGPPTPLADREARALHAIARLRSGVTLDRAQAAIDLVAARLAREHPEDENVSVVVLRERLARPEEDQARTNAFAGALMLAIVSLVTLMAAVNVANLLLARGETRRREFAIRAALGAARGRLIRQAMAECLLLAALGGGTGIVLANWIAKTLAAVQLPGNLPVRFDFHFDVRVLAYTVLVVCGAGAAAGVMPALGAGLANPDVALRDTRSGSTAADRGNVAKLLVASQMAVCVVLLVSAGLFARSLWRAERADLGFAPDGVVNVALDLHQLGYNEAQGRVFFEQVERDVRALAGVDAVSFAFTVPMGYVRVAQTVAPDDSRDRVVIAGKNVVSAEYFRVMGVRLLRGRGFDARDADESQPVAIVNDTLARQLWPGRDPIGQRLTTSSENVAYQVVGVANTGKYRFLFEPPQPFYYVPVGQEYTALRVLQVRTSLNADALAPVITRAIRNRAPDLPLYDVQTMRAALGSGPGLFPVRVAAAASLAFGALAATLCIVGLYGVIAGITTRRTREIGVRLAVGATRGDIVALAVGEGGAAITAGLAAGLVFARGLSRFLDGLLFDVSAADLATYATVAPLLAAVALLACAIPAWRAARLDPAVTLRAQ